MTALLNIERLNAGYGDTLALRDVSLDVYGDELLVVLGPTGAGKTTLLRTIAGLHPPATGTIRIGGIDATRMSPADRDVAMVFQNFSLYPDRTVRENLAFPLRAPAAEIDDTEVDDRIRWAADLLHIARLLDRPAAQLSGGEMQRVAIGRAIVRRPRLFLFDEPLTNLDAKLRERLRVELIALQKDLETPAIYVTHDQAEALSMADRIAVLSSGRIVQTGSPEDIYNRPATPDIAKQLGYPPINILPVTQRDGFWASPTGEALLPAEHPYSTARLGIRPEDIGTTGGDIPGTIRVVEDIGPSRILLVEWAGCSVHILEPRTGRRSPGESITPHLRPDRVLVWPSDQG